MLKIVIVLTMLIDLFIIAIAESLSCYQCSSEDEYTCGEFFDPKFTDVSVTECPLSDAKYCIKTTGIFSGISCCWLKSCLPKNYVFIGVVDVLDPRNNIWKHVLLWATMAWLCLLFCIVMKRFLPCVKGQFVMCSGCVMVLVLACSLSFCFLFCFVFSLTVPIN